MAANTKKSFEADLAEVQAKLATTMKVDAADLPVTGNVITLGNGWFIRADPIAQRYTMLKESSGMLEDSNDFTNLPDLRRAVKRRIEIGTM